MRNSIIGMILGSALAMFAFSSSASASCGCAKAKVQCCKVVHHANHGGHRDHHMRHHY